MWGYSSVENQRELIIEVFPKVDAMRWGLASGGASNIDELRKTCAQWTLDIRLSNGEKRTVRAFFHGEMPTEDDKFSINKQIAEFFYGRVIYK